MTDYYYPKPSANGVCVYEIAQELISKNYEVHILCVNNGLSAKEYIHENAYVHSVAQDKIYYHLNREESKTGVEANVNLLKLWTLVNKARFLLETLLYPVSLPKLARRYYNKLEHLHKEHDFLFYLSMFRPIQAVYAGVKLKQKYPQIKLAYYALDSMTNNMEAVHFKSFKEKRDYKYEEKIHQYSDVILNLKCHERHYLDKKFDKYRQKMHTVDIPLIKENTSGYTGGNEKISVVYSGTLYPIRKPDFALKCFYLINDVDFSLDFFSKGSCESTIEEYQDKTQGKVRRNGYIQREELLKIIASSNFLLSIGNENMEAIPSKIFEYMSTLKPIIHFYKNDNDSCLPYLKDYPLALMIKEDENNIEEISREIKSFMKSFCDKTVTYAEILEKFEMNTPKYTVDILENLFKGE